MKIELAFSSCSAKWVPQSFERKKWSIFIAWAELKPDSILVLVLRAGRGLSPVAWFLVTGPTPIGHFSSLVFSRHCYGAVWMN